MGIAVQGLHAKAYGSDYRGFGVPYHVVARDRHHVLVVDVDTVITFHVPDRVAHEYLTCLDGSYWCEGLMSGLKKVLPVRMIYAIEHI